MSAEKQSHPHDDEEVELDFLERVRLRCPDYVPLLIPLGDLYTRRGRYQDGLDVDLHLVELCPDDPLVWYNLACSHSLTHALDEGMQALQRAVELGYTDVEYIREDRDLDALRSHPDFLQLMRGLE